MEEYRMDNNLPKTRKDEYETALEDKVKDLDKRLKIVEDKLNKRGRPPKENQNENTGTS